MELEAVGFWGAYFGSTALALVAALLAFTRSARRIAFSGALAAVMSAFYTLVFLGWIPVADRETLERLQALTAVASAAVLAILLFMMLGTFQRPGALARARRLAAVFTLVAFVLAWMVPANDALLFGIAVAFAMAVAALMASVASMRRGERTGRLTLAALAFVCTGMSILDWHAFHPDSTPWPLHAISAVAGMAYLLCIAVAIGTRYAYLIEVSKVMTRGPNFDPVTSMPSYAAGQRIGEPLTGADGKMCGIIVVSISNLKMLEELHGRSAYNHALFVCASRLRSMDLPGIEFARLREDAFLLFARHPRDAEQMVRFARRVLQRLSRRVVLGTSAAITELEGSRAVWEANVGIGVLVEPLGEDPAVTVAGARAMSRTAWSYASRIAWYDEAAGAMAEVPAMG